MSIDPKKRLETYRLPLELADRLTGPFVRFLHIESAAGAILLVFTIAALIISNSPWAGVFQHVWETQISLRVGSFSLAHSLRQWINDGLMTLFFFLVALELKRELVLGELKKPRTAALSIAAALGGMLVPAAIYLAFDLGQPGQHGWGTVTATDTAFVISCLGLLKSRVPRSLRVFMLSLAIVDDIGAIVIATIGYTTHIVWWPLAVAVSGLVIVHVMARLGYRGFSSYILVGGLIWVAVGASGIHPTITGVILGLMTPARRWVSDERLYGILRQVVAHPTSSESNRDTKDRQTLQIAEIAARETLSPLERLEIVLHPWVGFLVMPLFAFVNAEFPINIGQLNRPIVVAIVIGLVLGKPIGILSFSWLSVRLHIATRPPALTWRLLLGGSLLGGIGFTMALFMANIAFGAELIDSAKMGILIASFASAILGLGFCYSFLDRSPNFESVASRSNRSRRRRVDGVGKA